MHGGTLSASAFGSRMKGEGKFALHIKQLFSIYHKKYFKNKDDFEYNLKSFKNGSGQLELF